MKDSKSKKLIRLLTYLDAIGQTQMRCVAHVLPVHQVNGLLEGLQRRHVDRFYSQAYSWQVRGVSYATLTSDRLLMRIFSICISLGLKAVLRVISEHQKVVLPRKRLRVIESNAVEAWPLRSRSAHERVQGSHCFAAK